MSVAALATKPADVCVPAEPVYTAYQFSVKQYHRMAAEGILCPEDRVELLEGWIITKMTQNPPHAGTIGLVDPLIKEVLPAEFKLRIQLPITLAKSEPEPDLAIVRGPGTQYLKRHPRPADIAVLIEVADSSHMDDRRYKGTLYATAKVREFWLINLVEGIVEVYTRPKGGKAPAYRQRQNYRKGEQVPLVLDGKEVARLAVSDLCPVKA